MNSLIKGKVWCFGKNIDTDAMVPGQYLDASMEEIAPHVFENIMPEFASCVKKGDIIVAGANFGCGSSRENAPEALKRAGISCIIAESFGRIFFRNAIAIGLPVITCKNISHNFQQGQTAEISLESSRVAHMETGRSFQGDPLSREMRDILDKGGIIEYLKESILTTS